MSGITGIFRRDGRDVHPDEIKGMNDKIAHRGPDGSQIWCEGPVAFGHQMLHTTPESLHEELPFEDKESGLVITADARIDNRNELASKLGIEDNEYVSDSYFILKAYEKWGEKCPEELLGDFAFAIWDKNKEWLFSARDHMGVKPFYYYLSDDLFLFASEIKSFSSINETPFKINELEIGYHLALIAGEDREMTIYKNILRLPASNSLTVSTKNNSFNQYWALDISNEILLDDDKEYETIFRDIFTETVRCRLRSALPVGSMLSGGLDSSSVVCTAQKILQLESGKNLKTFSAVFDSVPESNERYYIEKVLSSSNFDSYFINADKISPLREIDSFFWYRDQPLIVPNTFMNWEIIREANRNNVRVLLDGFEGDATVSHGQGFLAELARSHRFKKLYSELNALRKFGINPFNIIFFDIGFNLLPKFLRRKIINLREKQRRIGSKTRIIEKNFIDHLQLIEIINEISEEQLGVIDAHEMHYLFLKTGLLQYEMELLDALSAPFSVELRHPFFDKRLIEFCLAIPTEQKFSYGLDRNIIRRALADILPDEIRLRKSKGNLSYNFKNALMNEQEFLDNLILTNTSQIKNYVDINRIQEIYLHCKSGNTTETLYIWNVVVLSSWLRKMSPSPK